MMGIFFFFIFGLIIGSFLNAVIYRLNSEESIAHGRSHCFSCGHVLGFLDLIPLFSFIFLKGKCRYCKDKFSWQYPIVELITGLLFMGCFYFYIFLNPILTTQIIWQFVVTLVLISFSVVIFVYDLRYLLIADSVVFPIVLIMTLVNLFIFKQSWQGLALAAAIPMLFFWLQLIISKGAWIGSGDIYLGLLMGVTLGWPKVIIGLVLSYWVGSLISISLVIFGKKGWQSQIPFGPFLMIGMMLAWFWGDNVLKFFHLYG